MASSASEEESSTTGLELSEGGSLLSFSAGVSFGVSLSSASRADVALSMAAFQSESLRWQAAMLDFRTAISYSR